MARKERRPEQRSLFGDPPAAAPLERGRGRRVGPAPVGEALHELADRLPPEIRLGTSSWSFPGWAGSVYDRKASASHLARHGLAAYARHPLLRAAGIDRTYYAPLAAADFAAYAEVVPDRFRFLVKAARRCTDPHERGLRGRATGHNELFLDAAFARDEVVGPYVEGLGHRGGALLFQFPALGLSRAGDPETFAAELGRFLRALPTGPLYAVELRDRSLLGAAYAAALAESGAVHCFSAHPRMPSPGEQRRKVGLQRVLIGRWMLHSTLGYTVAQERYAPYAAIVDDDSDTRFSFAELCLEQIASGGGVIVTANNKAEGSAPETLFRLAGLIVELFDRSRG